MSEFGEGKHDIVKPPFYRQINLKKAIYPEEALDAIVKQLHEEKRYSDQLVYRGFNGERVDIVRKHATDIPDGSLWAATEEEWRRELEQGGSVDPFSYALENEIPAISIYRRNLLVLDIVGSHKYNFPEGKDPKKALVGVFFLRNVNF